MAQSVRQITAPVTLPYVVGQWVRGRRFYGRAAQLTEILRGPRNALWLLGTRRVGKTSLLKQLEHLTAESGDGGWFPLFWDFQGSEDPAELHHDFGDAVLDAEERLAALAIDCREVMDDDLFVSLDRLRRRLRARRRKLLLLCDEVEELITLRRKSPALLPKLRRAMQSRDGIRSVLTSSLRLWALADERHDTSPFLHGFIPPLYLAGLSDEEARSLIRQSNLPKGERPAISEPVVEAIRARCDNHPYLLQMLAKRYLESAARGTGSAPDGGDLEEACEWIASDRMVSYFFATDYELLAPIERQALHTLLEESPASSKSLQAELGVDTSSLAGALQRLEHLGWVRRDVRGRWILASYFFRRWLKEAPARGLPASVPETAAGTSAGLTLTLDAVLGQLDRRYELLERIGVGASGVVYKAYDKLLQVKIAIKVLKPEYARNEEAIERFRQEIVLSRDIGHPNILRAYHLGEADGSTYLTMQLVEGPTLARKLGDEGPLPPPRIVALGSKLADALAAAHARQVLHRDIKPSNVLVGKGVEPFLTDFGLARVIGGPGITRGGLFLGTPYYTSPEQAALQPLDGRSDLYALGVVLYEMATGHRPFEAPTSREILELHRTVPAPDPRDRRSELGAELAQVILRCLEKDPSDRYPDAHALRQALLSVAV